jgi:hypothetical protein
MKEGIGTRYPSEHSIDSFKSFLFASNTSFKSGGGPFTFDGLLMMGAFNDDNDDDDDDDEEEEEKEEKDVKFIFWLIETRENAGQTC